MLATSPIKRPWKIHRPHPESAALAAALGVSPVVGRLLANRGLLDAKDAARWLAAPWRDVTGFESLSGADEAGLLLAEAAQHRQRICLYGDYDVDGTTGVSILFRALTHLGADVSVYLPHRLEEGYGVNPNAVRRIAASGHRLLVTVDCGITAVEESNLADSLGMRMIVTDHHRPKEQLPEQAILVHPSLPGRTGSIDNLCGSAVAWKVACSLVQAARGSAHLGDLPTPDLEHLLDSLSLAAMGTVADIVPLTGENRLLVRHGLERLTASSHPGLQAIREVSAITGNVLAEDVGFRIGPRFNAAGRLGCAMRVVELLTTQDPVAAMGLAKYLDYANLLRQKIERGILASAIEQAEEQVLDGRSALVVASADWHPGVIGIVASRLVERFQRPAMIISFGTRSGIGYGSGRSTPSLALNTALQACGSHLVTHGGHAMAAGFKVQPEHFQAFQEAFWDHSEGTFGGIPPPQPLVMEAELPLSELSVALVYDLAALEPHGAGNPRPLFFIKDARLDSMRVIGKDKTHLSLTISQPGSSPVRCIAFGMAERRDTLRGWVDLAAVPRINEYQGRRTAELEVKDIRPATR